MLERPDEMATTPNGSIRPRQGVSLQKRQTQRITPAQTVGTGPLGLLVAGRGIPTPAPYSITETNSDPRVVKAG